MKLQILEIMLVAVALGCDAFAVGLGIGTRHTAPRQVFRLSFHFGLFQFLMPLVGWFLGRNLVGVVTVWGPWIACAVLVLIGGHMIYESLERGSEKTTVADPTRGFSLVFLSLATSIDALGVGFSVGVLGRTIFLAAVLIGLTAAAMTWTAMKLGERLFRRFGKHIGIGGGLILMGIGIKFLIS